MRALVALISTLFVIPSWAAGGPIDLGRPGVLDQLKHDHPAHYLAVAEILRIAEETPCKAGELEIVKTRYDVRDWKCNFLVLTSYPAKRHLSFALEGTRYVATVTLRDSLGRITPLVEQR